MSSAAWRTNWPASPARIAAGSCRQTCDGPLQSTVLERQMETSLANLQAAYAEHCAGRLEEAERLYRQILSCEPRNPHALHLLGVTLHQRRRHAEAIEWISRAIAVDSGNYSFYVNLSAAHL